MSSQKISNGKSRKKHKIGYNFCYDFVKITGALPVLAWIRPKVIYPYGRPKLKGAVLISANHRRFLDPIIVHTAIKWRRLHCLATTGLYDTKLKARFFKLMHCIEVDKNNFSIASFHDVVTRLEEGKAVVIFPEGQINDGTDKKVLAFKSGAVLMAHKSGAPILPMYIVKKEKWYQRQKIVVGELFDVGTVLGRAPSIADLSEVSALLREKELALLDYYDALTKKKNGRKKSTESAEKEKIPAEEYIG